MTYRGRIKDGAVVLDQPTSLPEGAEVRVEVLRADEPQTTAIPTLHERMEGLIGRAKGLPPDLARNHDHYLHGRDKQ